MQEISTGWRGVDWRGKEIWKDRNKRMALNHKVHVSQSTKSWATGLHVWMQDWVASYVQAMFHFKTHTFSSYSTGASRREITVVTLKYAASFIVIAAYWETQPQKLQPHELPRHEYHYCFQVRKTESQKTEPPTVLGQCQTLVYTFKGR